LASCGNPLGRRDFGSIVCFVPTWNGNCWHERPSRGARCGLGVKAKRLGRGNRVSDEKRGETSEAGDEQPELAKGTDRVTYTSAELLQGRREVWIEHGGEMYRLRVTAQGKLYLTK
jgi:hemin uptake protein HemP